MSHPYLPWFITEPGQTDVLMVAMAIFVVLFMFGFVVLILRLHRIPMQIAQQKVQYEIVAVLCLLALFTQENPYWIVALLLAVVDLPDFRGRFVRVADNVERITLKRRKRSERSRRR
jgi:hypothetical protein